jgi:segregation and condensation protein B
MKRHSASAQLRGLVRRGGGRGSPTGDNAAVEPLIAFSRPHMSSQRLLLAGGAVGRGGGVSLARRSRLEAILFLAREPLPLRKLAQLANLTDATEARTVLTSLNERYDARGSAFQVAQVAGGYQLLSRREFAPWLRTQSKTDRQIRLSPPAMETLAVVAYRQPILRAEVEAIRGVACGEILRQLMDRDFLRIVGRAEELGRPLRYGTTKRFLEVFGLASLEQLPWAEQLRRGATSGSANSESEPEISGSQAGLTDDSQAA